jgi:hypothetical protein
MPIAFYRLLLPEKGKPTPEMLGCWVRVFEQERIASDLSGKNPNCGPLAHSLPCHKWEGSLMTQSRLRSSAAKTFAICPNADLHGQIVMGGRVIPRNHCGLARLAMIQLANHER